MKRTLQIHIDANRVTCGKCRGAVLDMGDYYAGSCDVFGEPLRRRHGGVIAELHRCAPCLAAEREAT